MKKIRLSYYTIPVILSKDNDKLILIHGNTGAIDVVSTRLYSVLNNINDNVRVPESLKELLIKRGYLTYKSYVEELEYTHKLIDLKCKSDFFKSCDITWVVSYKCNFCCPYCFESNNVLSSTFSKRSVDKVYSSIDNYIEENKIIKRPQIVLFGGEPLLAENRKIVEYIVSEGVKRGCLFSAVTNGYDLDEYMDLICCEKISKLQITLDGTKQMHDSRRFHYKDGATFDKIIQNIQRIKEKNVKVAIRMNVDRDGVVEFAKLYNYLQDIGLLCDNISVYAARLMEYEDVDLSIREDISIPSVREYMDMQKENNTADKCKDYDLKSRFLYAINNNTAFPFKTVGCAISKGGVVVDPFGYLYPCWELVGKKEYIIGNYFRGKFALNNAALKWHRSMLLTDENCRSCKFALICGGGCPKRNGIERRQNCFLFQQIFKTVVNNAFYEIQG